MISCQPNFQQEYGGNVPLVVQNRSSHEVNVYVKPLGKIDQGKRWGEPIAPRGSATYKVKPGEYTLIVDVTKRDGIMTYAALVAKTSIQVSRPAGFIVADNQIRVPANAQLLVLAPPVHDAPANNEGGVQSGQCVAAGNKTEGGADSCCSGRSHCVAGCAYHVCCTADEACL